MGETSSKPRCMVSFRQINVAVGDGVEKGEPVHSNGSDEACAHAGGAGCRNRISHSLRSGETVPAGAVLIEITPTEAKEAV